MPDLHRDGYDLADLVLSAGACERILDSLPAVPTGRGGLRNVIDDPTVVAVLRDARFSAAIGIPGLAAVKATLFDKNAAGSWRLQWHQDRTIAVRERRDAPEYGSWAMKHGVQHVEPPAGVLEEMLSVRIQLDECGPDDGPLRVVPGSHRRGKLGAEEIARVAEAGPIVQLTWPRGASLLMRPLLVHASLPALEVRHRRVLHVELASPRLIAPLEWHDCIPL